MNKEKSLYPSWAVLIFGKIVIADLLLGRGKNREDNRRVRG